jgi:hypothetical protein
MLHCIVFILYLATASTGREINRQYIEIEKRFLGIKLRIDLQSPPSFLACNHIFLNLTLEA